MDSALSEFIVFYQRCLVLQLPFVLCIFLFFKFFLSYTWLLSDEFFGRFPAHVIELWTDFLIVMEFNKQEENIKIISSEAQREES